MPIYIIGMNILAVIAMFGIYSIKCSTPLEPPDWSACSLDANTIGYIDKLTLSSLGNYIYRLLSDAIARHGMNRVYIDRLYMWSNAVHNYAVREDLNTTISKEWDLITMDYDRGKRDFARLNLPVNLPYYLTNNEFIDLEGLNLIFME